MDCLQKGKNNKVEPVGGCQVLEGALLLSPGGDACPPSPQTECFNHVRFLQRLNSTHLYSCGTYAFHPLCASIVSTGPTAVTCPLPPCHPRVAQPLPSPTISCSPAPFLPLSLPLPSLRGKASDPQSGVGRFGDAATVTQVPKVPTLVVALDSDPIARWPAWGSVPWGGHVGSAAQAGWHVPALELIPSAGSLPKVGLQTGWWPVASVPGAVMLAGRVTGMVTVAGLTQQPLPKDFLDQVEGGGSSRGCDS